MHRSGLAVLLFLVSCGPLEPQWLLAQTGTTGDLLAVHGSSASDVWAVGRGGLVLHFDGVRWARIETSLPTTFSSVYAAAPNDVWVVGEEGVMLRWNGVAFTRVSGRTGHYRAVVGLGPSEIYFASNGSAEYWDGSTFNRLSHFEDGSMYSVTATSLTGGGAAGVWAVGSGYVYRLNKTVATKQVFDTSGSWDCAVVGPNAFWVFDNSGYEHGTVLRGDGTKWVKVDFPRTTTFVEEAVFTGWANAADDVWFIGGKGSLWHWDGREISRVASGTSLAKLWGSADDLWGAGAGGKLARRFVK